MKPAHVRLSRFELEVMDQIWSLRECSVRDVCDALGRDRAPAYTTIQTIVQRLEQKGAVVRVGKSGNALMFKASVTRKIAYRRLVDDFLAIFGGSPVPMVAHLLDEGRLTLKDLKDLEQLSEEQRSSSRGRK